MGLKLTTTGRTYGDRFAARIFSLMVLRVAVSAENCEAVGVPLGFTKDRTLRAASDFGCRVMVVQMQRTQTAVVAAPHAASAE